MTCKEKRTKKTIGVLFGGQSGEHAVSLMSATSVIRAIDEDKYQVVMIGITPQGRWLLFEGAVEDVLSGAWQAQAEADLARDPERFALTVLGEGPNQLRDKIDFALPILHGPNGEDGTVQGLLELLDLPYGGSGVLGAAASMDKVLAKTIFAAEHLRQAPYIALDVQDLKEGQAWLTRRIDEELTYPLFVKPANMGSSVGITKVNEEADLAAALALAARYDSRLLVEQGIDCRELETAILGNELLTLGSVGEVLPAAEFYDYQSKYFDAGSKFCIPADISQEQKEELQNMAARAYKALGCQGFARVDFLMDKRDGRIYINEVNAIPGFTHASAFPLLCMDIGMTYGMIVERIVELGYERYFAKNNREDHFP